MIDMIWGAIVFSGVLCGFMLGHDLGYRKGRHDEFYDHHPELRK